MQADNVEQLFKPIGEPTRLRPDVAFEFFAAVLALTGAGYSVEIKQHGKASLRARVVKLGRHGALYNVRVADVFGVDPADATAETRTGVGYLSAEEFPNDYLRDEMFNAVIGEVIRES